MPDLSTTIQVVSNHTAQIAIIISTFSVFISIYSFYYGRKPLINITSKDIGANYVAPAGYEFTIKNVSQNPAKDVLVSVKLIDKETTHNIDKYSEFAHLNPEDEQVISISDSINSKLINLEKLTCSNCTRPEDATGRDIKAIEKLCEDYGYSIHDIIVSYGIDKDFKISIEFEITCRADIPKIFSLLFRRDKFRYNFEVSYQKYEEDDLDYFSKNERYKYLAISYGYENNFILIIKPSNGGSV